VQPNFPPNMAALLEQAQQLQEQFAAMDAHMSRLTATGTDGTGSISVTMTAEGRLTDVRIHPRVVDPAKAELLGDLVRDALINAATDLQQQAEKYPMPGPMV
jgi:DNA-binding YbaB/EbfC family protein